MLYLCHQRRAGAYSVGRTWRPHLLFSFCTVLSVVFLFFISRPGYKAAGGYCFRLDTCRSACCCVGPPKRADLLHVQISTFHFWGGYVCCASHYSIQILLFSNSDSDMLLNVIRCRPPIPLVRACQMPLLILQEAQLTQRSRATLCVVGNVTQGHSRSFEIAPFSSACLRSYQYLSVLYCFGDIQRRIMACS